MAESAGGPLRIWIGASCAALSAVVPFALAVSRMASVPEWRERFPLLRGLALVGASGGEVTTVLMQLLTLAPVGTRVFRAALVAAMGGGGAGVLLYVMARRILSTNVDTPRLTAVLSAIAALTATLSPAWQREATVAGGATVAAAMVLGAMLVQNGPGVLDHRRTLGVGTLLGGAFVESPAAGLAIALASMVRAAVVGRRPTRHQILLFGMGLLFCSLALSAPMLLRPAAPRALVDLGRALRVGLGGPPCRGKGLPFAPLSPFLAWARELGPLPLALAGFGAFIGIARQRLRWMAVPLFTWPLADSLLGTTPSGVLSPDPFAPVRLLAVATLAIGAALGVQTVAALLLGARVPMARGAAVLLVVFDLTLVTMTQEAASFAADLRSAGGAEAWTDEALERLPPRAAILARSRPGALRIRSARLLQGVRPDLLVVPVPLVGEGGTAARLLRAEPATMPLVRDVTLSGLPTENALTTLADARPVECELDPGWDRRIVSHLVADRMWLRFAPQPLGASDRRLAFAAAQAPFARVLAVSRADDAFDPAVVAILAAHLREQATVAAMLGDREEAIRMLEQLAGFSKGDPFIADLTQRLAERRTGPIDVKNLRGK